VEDGRRPDPFPRGSTFRGRPPPPPPQEEGPARWFAPRSRELTPEIVTAV